MLTIIKNRYDWVFKASLRSHMLFIKIQTGNQCFNGVSYSFKQNNPFVNLLLDPA